MTTKKNNLIYVDDLHGYDGLYLFSDIFPTVDEFVEKMNESIYFHTLDVNDDLVKKIFNNMFNRYKNNFFRYQNISTIYMKMSQRVETMLQAYDVAKDFNDNLMDYVGSNETKTNYKTNNTSENSDLDNEIKYKTNIEHTNTDNGIEYMDRRTQSVELINVIQEFIDDLKTLFMNRTDENVYNDIYTK